MEELSRPADHATTVVPADAALIAKVDALYVPIETSEPWASVAEPVVWHHAVARLTEAQTKASPEALRQAVEIAMRAAAVDTGAIEGLYEVDRGFTFSVALQSTAWQAAMAEKGGLVRELFEAQLRAYELALDIATRHMPVTEAWIRTLHEELCAPQEAVQVLTPQGWQEQRLLKGEYKRLPNHVLQPDGTPFAFAPVGETPREMQRLVQELNSERFLHMHPIGQAAYAHYSFVRIHPFQDGNGRVARTLASVYLYRAFSVPFVVFEDEKADYFDALRRADAGELVSFLEFVFERVLNTIDLVTEQLDAAPDQRIEELRSVLLAGEGLTHVEVDEVGYTLLEALHAELTNQLGHLALPPGTSVVSSRQQVSPVPDVPGFRPLWNRGILAIQVSGTVQPPANANTNDLVQVFIRQATTGPLMFRVASQLVEPLDLRLRDVHPKIKTHATLRLGTWIKNELDELLSQLTTQARRSLHQHGYS